MDEGYIKLFRQSIDSWVFSDPSVWKIWTWCLMKASYRKRSVSVKISKGVSIVEISPGQFITGRDSAAKQLKVNSSFVYRWLKKFESDGMITIKSNSHYSLVTICNWDTYQSQTNTECATNEQPTNSQRTANEQPTNTNKKVKNIKKVKNKEYPQNSETEFQDTSIYFPEEIVKMVKGFHDYNLKLNFDIMKSVKLNLKGSCDTVDKLIRIDNYTLKEIRDALYYAVKDERFWKFQIQSLASLRGKGKNGLMKFQNLYADYQRSLITPKNGHEEKPQVYTLPVKKEYI